MKRTIVIVSLLTVSCLPVTSALAQEHYTEGTVSRVLLFDAAPGKLNDCLADLRQNLKPVYDEMKKQGVIQDYAFSLNLTSSSPEDWDVSVRIVFANLAALDGLAAKTDPITLKFYGGKDERQKALDKRVTICRLSQSRLTRQITLK
ncbi:MAG TPA: hypothetical protein VFQ26_03510 [Nitrospiraceae bacterium]|nr:hypothetical protein [Nitrospiraceae bacterium]